jgi:hypothetical protein
MKWDMSHGTSQLLHLGPPNQAFDVGYLDEPGGYAWWYADLIDDEGRVAVMILSFGLPFLPGYRKTSEQEPEMARPRDWPSVNLAIYENGRPSFYALSQVSAAESDWDLSADTWRFGKTSMRREKVGRGFSLKAELALPEPGAGSVKGTLEINGIARAPEGAGGTGHGLHPHVWAPQTGPAQGTLVLKRGDKTIFSMKGRAYQDQNAGSSPLWRLGMDSWIWARFPHPDHEEIFYLVWGEGEDEPGMVWVKIDENGKTHLVEGGKIKLGPMKSTYAGMRHPQWIHIEPKAAGASAVKLDIEDPIDVGPFYLRFQTTRHLANGQKIPGVGETCVPENIDRDWQRFFVNMRVHQQEEPNSMWLPLFSGPRKNRFRRLLKSWVSRAPR